MYLVCVSMSQLTSQVCNNLYTNPVPPTVEYIMAERDKAKAALNDSQLALAQLHIECAALKQNLGERSAALEEVTRERDTCESALHAAQQVITCCHYNLCLCQYFLT